MFKLSLIASLNNPRSYSFTRHNIGSWWLNEFCSLNNISITFNKFYNSYIGKLYLYDNVLHLLEPNVYMNINGEVINAYCNDNNISYINSMIVHDDLDLNVGCIRIKFGGGNAGHKGLISLTNSFSSSEFLRLRIGIGKPINKSVSNNYVLSKCSFVEEKIIKKSIYKSMLFIDDLVNLSWSLFMNKFHSK